MKTEKFKLFHKGGKVFYYVGDLGSIKTILISTGKERVLRPSSGKTCKWDKQGYLQITINLQGRLKSFRVHQLVMSKFGNQSRSKRSLEINHKDGNKHNNKISNLEWVSRRYNMTEAYRLGLISKPNTKGDKNHNYGKFKYPKAQIDFALALLSKGETLTVAANSAGINVKNLWRYRKTLGAVSAP